MYCATCKYFTKEFNKAGRCNRYPQSVTKDRDDWCGEYKSKSESKSETEQKDANK